MKKNQVKCERYFAPRCEVIELDNDSFICAVSVQPNPGSGSSMTPWEEKNHEGGTGFIGDESNMAPAKDTWFDDDEDF